MESTGVYWKPVYYALEGDFTCLLVNAAHIKQLPGLDSWSGIGHVAVGMHRQGYDLQLTQYDDRGWRARGLDGPPIPPSLGSAPA
jgi:hypothetical protein